MKPALFWFQGWFRLEAKLLNEDGAKLFHAMLTTKASKHRAIAAQRLVKALRGGAS